MCIYGLNSHLRNAVLRVSWRKTPIGNNNIFLCKAFLLYLAVVHVVMKHLSKTKCSYSKTSSLPQKIHGCVSVLAGQLARQGTQSYVYFYLVYCVCQLHAVLSFARHYIVKILPSFSLARLTRLFAFNYKYKDLPSSLCNP